MKVTEKQATLNEEVDKLVKLRKSLTFELEDTEKSAREGRSRTS